MQLLFVLFALSLAWLGSNDAFAQDSEISGEILKISKKRTIFLIDLAGDTDVSEGTAVEMAVGEKIRTGTIKSVSSAGKAMIKINKGLPASVERGDFVKLLVSSGGSSASSPSSVRLAKGYKNKAYWDDVSYLANHRRAGTRSDIEVSYLGTQGAREATGGVEGADIEYEYLEKTTAANGSAGWVGRGGIGGGFLFDYASSARETSADVDTEATSSTDQLKDKFERTVTNFTPYVAFLSRPKTGDLGFGAGLGVLIRSSSSEYSMKDGVDQIDPKPTKVTQVGPTLELLKGTNSWALILQFNPGIKGKEKQTGFDDVERTSSEYGAHFETYANSTKARLGIVIFSEKGKSDLVNQKDSGYKFSARLDSDFRSFHLVEYVDYSSLKRRVDQAEGTQSVTEVGVRLAMAGVYAPFVAIGVSLLGEKQSGDNIPDTKTSAGGVKFAGGISI